MSVLVPLPTGELRLDSAIFDVNGTLTVRGELVDGVADLIKQLCTALRVLLVSADTYGTLDGLAAGLGVDARRVTDAADKLGVLREVGADTCVAIGNGHNDRALLAEAALGIAVIGAEGASSSALTAADLVCSSVIDAISLLLYPTSLVATLRP
ncbi:MAG TPA: hypothetical protein VHC43_01390 [Mycobacteriales bacterium]|nr:hypothetical protein [Mycobacteriales bacterium]